jgi:hypothetical protein
LEPAIPTSDLERELADFKMLFKELDQRVRADSEALRELVAGAAHPGPLIAFVHIPKTAGATVTSMLAAAYSRRALHKAGNYMRNHEASERKLSKESGGWDSWRRGGGRVTVGHVPYGAFRRHLPAGTRYMTFLREPVDRVLSHYYRHIHIRDPSRSGRVERRPGARVKAGSIEQALVELRMPQVNNLCTRFLSGRDPIAELPDGALDDAKDNLRSFAFVGIQEQFEESIVLLKRVLGLGDLPYEDRHVSRAGSRPAVDEITDEQRQLIASCNCLDAELYRFGLGLFEEAVAGAGDGFEEEVEKLRARDKSARKDEWHRVMDASDARSQ